MNYLWPKRAETLMGKSIFFFTIYPFISIITCIDFGRKLGIERELTSYLKWVLFTHLSRTRTVSLTLWIGHTGDHVIAHPCSIHSSQGLGEHFPPFTQWMRSADFFAIHSSNWFCYSHPSIDPLFYFLFCYLFLYFALFTSSWKKKVSFSRRIRLTVIKSNEYITFEFVIYEQKIQISSFFFLS